MKYFIFLKISNCLLINFIEKLIITGTFNKFPDFFVRSFKIIVDSWKFTILLLYSLRDDWPIFDFSFKWTATAGIGIHPTKVWLLQLVKFKNAI